MDTEALFDLLSSSTGEEWREASLLLQEQGYAWEWVLHRDGPECFLLTDAGRAREG